MKNHRAHNLSLTSQRIGFVLGLVAFFALVSLPPFDSFLRSAQEAVSTVPVLEVESLAASMQTVLALLLLMVVWWITEAVPLAVTALLPVLVLPFFTVHGFQGSAPFEFTTKNVLLNYANPVIYLFFGGFLLAGAMQKWKLDRRITLWLLTRGNLANDTRSVLLGIMGVTAFMSMWISNTATAAMMLPLGLGVLSLVQASPGRSRYGTAVMLGIAWSASIGGVGTIIGTPPNGIAIGILNATFSGDPGYHRITFLDWMLFGVPYVVLFVPLAWWIILKMNPPEFTQIAGGKATMVEERSRLGPLSRGERLTVMMFFLAVLLWVTNPFWNSLFPASVAARLQSIDEYSIGVAIGILLFLIPVSFKDGKFLLDWQDTKYVDWGTLLLFGGGIALSDSLFKTGLASLIAGSFVGLLGTPSTLVMLVAVVLLIDFLTEITSNTAVTSMMVPIMISIAAKTTESPVTLAIGTAVAASLGFMLPVATPPNALVFASGYVPIRTMIRSGFWLDIAGWVLTLFVLIVIGGLVFKVIPL